MSKVRTIGLDTQDIDETIKSLKGIQKGISKETQNRIESILDQAVEYCRSKCPPTFTDYNIYWEKTENGYRIVQEGAGVVFVEFGTGVVGKGDSHKISPIEFGLEDYDTRHNNVNKFVYNGNPAWHYPKKDGSWGITSGQKAHMQMFQTAEWLREKLPIEISMVIGEVVRKW